ncbi:peptidoglycan-binding protein [Priestia sp. YIM B13489]|uniref:peptidoglycan-binding protein n=1 Tax=Priestia sp. YIM B13489 TaxID=3366313 RepID=UPI0036729566
MPETPKKDQSQYKYPLVFKARSINKTALQQLQNTLNAVYFKYGTADGIYRANTKEKLQAVLKSKGY